MILNNINEAKQFLPSLNLTLENDRFKDFFRRAQEWLVSHIVGTDIEDVLETDISVGQEDIHADLRLLCQRVIAEKALLDAIPEMDLQLTEAGFAVQSNDDFSPASAQRVDRLLAKMPERIANDIDGLVRFLMTYSTGNAAYGYWRSSDQFDYLTAAFITCFEEYKSLCNGVSRNANAPMTYDDFYAIIPLMARELRKSADYYVSKEEVDRLVGLFREGDLLDIHRRAISNLKETAVAALRYDTKRANDTAVCARDVMLSDPDSFPAFKASSAFNSPTVNLDGGNMVNML